MTTARDVKHCTCCHLSFRVNEGPTWVYADDPNMFDGPVSTHLGMCAHCNTDMCQCAEWLDAADQDRIDRGLPPHRCTVDRCHEFTTREERYL